jgi:hypothetical protein
LPLANRASRATRGPDEASKRLPKWNSGTYFLTLTQWTAPTDPDPTREFSAELCSVVVFRGGPVLSYGSNEVVYGFIHCQYRPSTVMLMWVSSGTDTIGTARRALQESRLRQSWFLLWMRTGLCNATNCPPYTNTYTALTSAPTNTPRNPSKLSKQAANCLQPISLLHIPYSHYTSSITRRQRSSDSVQAAGAPPL